jgi:hypothetical protein
MSTVTTHASRDCHREVNNGHEIAVTPDQGDRGAVYQLIAHVLCRAHRAAEDLGEPNEARAIFHVAVSFADELTTTNPEFDRLRFIKSATGLP